MSDPVEPLFDLQTAGGRPSTEWTGFFGQVLDATGNPLAGVPLILWYPDPVGNPVELVGAPDSPVVRTDADGNYEIRLADAPFGGIWTIQVLTDDGEAASKLFTFETSDDPEQGLPADPGHLAKGSRSNLVGGGKRAGPPARCPAISAHARCLCTAPPCCQV